MVLFFLYMAINNHDRNHDVKQLNTKLNTLHHEYCFPPSNIMTDTHVANHDLFFHYVLLLQAKWCQASLGNTSSLEKYLTLYPHHDTQPLHRTLKQTLRLTISKHIIQHIF